MNYTQTGPSGHACGCPRTYTHIPACLIESPPVRLGGSRPAPWWFGAPTQPHERGLLIRLPQRGIVSYSSQKKNPEETWPWQGVSTKRDS